MPKVSKQTASKVGLFSTVFMIIGSVVGIGIFFKNISVFNANGHNWVGVLVSWVIAIFMVLCIALSFAEISSCKLKHSSNGLGGWMGKFCGYGLGRTVSIAYAIVYYPVITLAVLIFAGEMFLNVIQSALGQAGELSFGKGTVGYVFLIGGAIFALFLFLNYFRSNQMFKFGKATGFVKILPLLAALVIGITMGCIYSKGGLFVGKYWSVTEGSFIDVPIPGSITEQVSGVITSIPAILFAFEGYLIVGNIGSRIENPEKNVPIVIVLVIVVISIVNLSISIGCMASGTGNINELISLIFDGDTHSIGCKVVTTIMSIFIFVCIVGVINGLTYTGISACQSACETNLLFRSKYLINKKPNGKLYAGTAYFGLTSFCWWAILLIPSAILNTDVIADGSSNILVSLFYLMYGTLLLYGFINRFTKNIQVRKVKIFPVTSLLGVIACYFVFIYCAFYQYLALPIMEPHLSNAAESWGLFAKPSDLLNWQTAIIFWVLAVGMIGVIFLNDIFIKNHDKQYSLPLIWQGKKHLNHEIL